jgi:hypothetical protein
MRCENIGTIILKSILSKSPGPPGGSKTANQRNGADGSRSLLSLPPPPGSQQYTISLKRLNPRTREFVENTGKFTIRGQDVLSKDGKSFDRIVSSKDAEGRDTRVIQVFEKQ